MKKYFLPLTVALIPILVAAYLYPELPDRIPGHYNIRGEVDRYDAKWSIFITASLGLFIYCLMLFIARFDPKGKVKEMGTKFDTLSLWLTILLSILSLILIYNAQNQSANHSILKSLNFFLGILFIILGNYMTSMKPNYFIGIRTPWTLESEVVWRKTHQLGGKLLFIAGILIIISCILPTSIEWKNKIMLGLIIVSSIIPLIYSFWIYKKLKE